MRGFLIHNRGAFHIDQAMKSETNGINMNIIAKLIEKNLKLKKILNKIVLIKLKMNLNMKKIRCCFLFSIFMTADFPPKKVHSLMNNGF